MKRKIVKFSIERQVLTWLLTSTRLLKEIYPIPTTGPELFESSFSRVIARWVWEYYEQTKEAPGKVIEDIYIRKRNTIRDEEEVDMVSKFLSSLSEEWQKSKKLNIIYATGEIIKYFKERSIKIIIRQAQNSLDRGDIGSAEKALSGYKRVKRKTGKAVDILNDYDRMTDAYNMENHHMVFLPGTLGEIMSPFCRGDFVGVLAPQGRGKTWWLKWLSLLIAQSGFNVLHINLEQQEAESLRRSFHILSNVPKKDESIWYPSFVWDECEETWRIEYAKQKHTGMINVAKEMNSVGLYCRSGGYWDITLPAMSTTWEDIVNEIDNMYLYDNLHFDAISVDYPDKLGAKGRQEYRHKLNDIYVGMRGYGVETNKLMLSASQSNKKGINGEIDQADMAEDIRKLSELTHLLILNQTRGEYQQQLMRVSNGKLREEKMILKQVLVTNCLQLGKPYVDSKYVDDVYYDKDREDFDYEN